VVTNEDFANWLVNDTSWEIMVVTKVLSSEYIDNRFIVQVLAVPQDDTSGLGESNQIIKFESYEEVGVGYIFFGFI
jgi:hypothetical protein